MILMKFFLKIARSAKGGGVGIIYLIYNIAFFFKTMMEIESVGYPRLPEIFHIRMHINIVSKEF